MMICNKILKEQLSLYQLFLFCIFLISFLIKASIYGILAYLHRKIELYEERVLKYENKLK